MRLVKYQTLRARTFSILKRSVNWPMTVSTKRRVDFSHLINCSLRQEFRTFEGLAKFNIYEGLSPTI